MKFQHPKTVEKLYISFPTCALLFGAAKATLRNVGTHAFERNHPDNRAQSLCGRYDVVGSFILEETTSKR